MESKPLDNNSIIKHIKDAGLDKLYGIVIEEHSKHPGVYMNGKKIEIPDMIEIHDIANIFGEDTFRVVDELVDNDKDNTGERK